MKQICVLLSVFLVVGCSSPEPLRVKPTQESFLQHRGKNCEQMEKEYRDELAKRRVFTELQAKKVEDESHAGIMLTAYAIPTLGLSFLVGMFEFADGDYRDELAKSKGSVVSLEEVMYKDGCEVVP